MVEIYTVPNKANMARAHAHLAEVMEPVLRILHDEHHLQLHDIGMPLDGADLNFLELWSQLEVQGAQGVHAEVVGRVAPRAELMLDQSRRCRSPSSSWYGGILSYIWTRLVPTGPNKIKTPAPSIR